jgi:hypothetical protein
MANALFDTPICCSHLLFITAIQPNYISPTIIFDQNQEELTINYILSDRHPVNSERLAIGQDILEISKLIQKYSHSHNKEGIIQFVEQQYARCHEFIGGYPVSFIEIVIIGIDHFLSHN